MLQEESGNFVFASITFPVITLSCAIDLLQIRINKQSKYGEIDFLISKRIINLRKRQSKLTQEY